MRSLLVSDLRVRSRSRDECRRCAGSHTGVFYPGDQEGHFSKAAPERGRLRTFLLNACQNFLTNEWEKTQAARRGGGNEALAEKAEGWFAPEPVTTLSPEALYHRRWALAVLEQALTRLRGEYDAEGKAELFAMLKPVLEEDSDADTQRAMAVHLGMSEGALRVAVFRLRRRYRAMLFAEVAQGLDVTTEEEVRQELSHLISAL